MYRFVTNSSNVRPIARRAREGIVGIEPCATPFMASHEYIKNLIIRAF